MVGGGWPASAVRTEIKQEHQKADKAPADVAGQEVLQTSIPRPNLSTRPLHTTCEHTIHAKPSEVYAAWTNRFDLWFAQPGTVSMVPEPGRPYFFYNRDEWGRHPHYGRFLDLKENRLIETT